MRTRSPWSALVLLLLSLAWMPSPGAAVRPFPAVAIEGARAAQPPQANAYLLRIRVRNSIGDPMQGVQVRLTAEGRTDPYRTGADGVVIASFAAPGDVKVSVSHADYTAQEQTVTLSRAGITVPSEFVLRLANTRAGYPLVVSAAVVVKGGPGHALEGADVRVYRSLALGSESTKTGPDGRAALTLPYRGTYTIEISHPNFGSTSRGVLLSSRTQPAEESFYMTAKGAYVLVEAKVVDGPAPVEGVIVAAPGWSERLSQAVTTDSFGAASLRFFLDERPPDKRGPITITATHPNYEPWSTTITPRPGGINELVPLSIKLTRRAGKRAVVVHTIESGTRAPIMGAAVTLDGGLSGGRQTVTTDSDGRAMFTVEIQTIYRIEVTTQYYDPASDRVDLVGADAPMSVEKTLELKRVFGSEKVRLAVVEVRGTDKAGRRVPVKADVTLSTGQSGSTDASGNLYRIHRVAGGERLGASAAPTEKGYKTASGDVTVGTRGILLDNNELQRHNFLKDRNSPYGLDRPVDSEFADQWRRTYGSAIDRITINLPTLTAADEEAPPPAASPLRLIVEVRDAVTNAGIGNAAIEFLSSDGASLHKARSDAGGEGDFTNALAAGRSPEELRKGMTLNVDREGYLRRANVLVDSKLLENAENRFTVHLYPDTLELQVEVRSAARPEHGITGARLGALVDGSIVETAGGVASTKLRLRKPAVPLERVWSSGLKLEVTHPNYQKATVDVTGDTLTSSQLPTVTVQLTVDWRKLEEALAPIEKAVTDWQRDYQTLVRTIASLNQRPDAARAAVLMARGRRRLIENSPPAAVAPGGPCQQAIALRKNVQDFATEAARKERELASSLASASSLAATCTSADDADAVKRAHGAAIRLTGEIGVLHKKAEADNKQLALLARQASAAAKSAWTVQDLEEAAKAIEETDAKKVADIERAAQADARRITDLSSALPARRNQTIAELDLLRSAWGLVYTPGQGFNHPVETLPAALKKRLDDVTGFGSLSLPATLTSPDAAALQSIRGAAAEIKGEKQKADELIASYKTACVVAPMDDVVKGIAELVYNAGLDLGLAADLPRQADDCAKRGKCAPVLQQVRPLLEARKLDDAETLIKKAQAQGCDVRPEEDELDYYRALHVISNAISQCEFGDAVTFGEKLPAPVKARSQIVDALGEAKRGVAAKTRVDQLTEQALEAGARGLVAQNAGRCDEATRHFAQADTIFAQAEAATGTSACLKYSIEGARRELDGRKGTCATPTRPDPTPPPPRGERGNLPPTSVVPEGLGGGRNAGPGRTGGTGGGDPTSIDPVPVLTATLDCGPILELRPGVSEICDVIVRGWNSRTTTPVRVQVTPNPMSAGVSANPGDTQSDPTTMHSTAASPNADRYVFHQGFTATVRAAPGASTPATVTVSQGNQRVMLPLTVNVIGRNAPSGSSMFPVGPVRAGTGGALCVFRFKTFGDSPECWSFESGSCASSKYADERYQRVAENLKQSEAAAIEMELSRYYGDAYACNAVQGAKPREPIPPPVVVTGQGAGGGTPYCTWRVKSFGDPPRCFHVAVAPCGKYGPPYELIGTNMTFAEASARGDQMSRYYDDELGCKASQRPPPPPPPVDPDPPVLPPTPPNPPVPPPTPPDRPRPVRVLSRFGIDPRDLTVKAGDTVALRALGIWSDAPDQVVDLTSEVRWSAGPLLRTLAEDAGRSFVVTATHPEGADSITITVAPAATGTVPGGVGGGSGGGGRGSGGGGGATEIVPGGVGGGSGGGVDDGVPVKPPKPDQKIKVADGQYQCVAGAPGSSSLVPAGYPTRGFAAGGAVNTWIPFGVTSPGGDFRAAKLVIVVMPLEELTSTDGVALKGASGKAAWLYTGFGNVEHKVWNTFEIGISDADVLAAIRQGGRIEGVFQDDSAVKSVQLCIAR